MKKVTDTIEEHILNKILVGDIKVNERIPSEKELQEKFNTSRTSVRFVLNYLKALGIIYSNPKGKLILSPFYSSNLIKKFEYTLQSDETIVLPTQTELPKKLFKLLKIEDEAFEQHLNYVKIYFKKKNPISYAISWINYDYINRGDINLKYLKNNSILDYFRQSNKFATKNIIKNEIVIMEKISKSDIKLLDLEENITFIPTLYSVYTLSKGQILQVRVTKVHPKDFKFEIIKQRFVNLNNEND